MRYELTDHEWAAIRPMLPSKPRDVPRVNDRRVLNGIFWVLRSGAPWRDLPKAFGPYTTCYNRFVRWRRAGVWSRIIDALAAAHQTGPQASRTRHRWRGGVSAVGVGEIPDDLAQIVDATCHRANRAQVRSFYFARAVK